MLLLSMEKLMQINGLYLEVFQSVLGILVFEHACGPQPDPFCSPRSALTYCLLPLPSRVSAVVPHPSPSLAPWPTPEHQGGGQVTFLACWRDRGPLRYCSRHTAPPCPPNNLPLSSVLAATAGSWGCCPGRAPAPTLPKRKREEEWAKAEG